MTEHRRAELRAEPGRRLVGTPMRYGAEARVVLPADGRAVTERFAAFAFMDYLRSGAATRLNLQHDPSIVVASTAPLPGRGRLELRDGPDDLRMIATLPEGRVYDDILSLVRGRDTAELSVEFRALEEQLRGDRRVVLQATLPAIGVVDAGAYAGTVEVRARGAGIAGSFRYNTPRVTADRGRRRKQSVRPGAFTYALEDEAREILLQVGDDAGQVLASRRAGTLTLTDTAAALEFAVETLPDTGPARDLAALLDAGTVAPGVLPFYRVPPADVVADAVTFEPEPGNPDVEIEVLHNVLLTALSIRYRAPRGNPGTVERRNHRDRERQRVERAQRSRRPWL